MKKITLFFATMLLSLGAWAQTPVTTVDQLSNDSVYTVNTSRGPWIYSAELNALASTNDTGVEANAEDPNQQFAFLTGSDGKVYLYSVGAGKFVIKSGGYTTTSDAPVDYITLEASTGSETYPTVVALNGTNHMGISTGYKPDLITHYNSLSDDGNRAVIVAVGAQDFSSVVPNIGTIIYTLTDEVGNSYTGSYEGVLGKSEPVLNGVQGCTYSDVEWNEEGDTVTATVKFPFPVSSETETNVMMLSNVNNDKKWRVIDGTDIKIQAASVAAPTYDDIEDWLWAIYPAFADGAFTFTIKNLATDKYVYTASTGGSHNTQGTMTVQETGTPFEVITYGSGISFKKPGENVYVSINSGGDTNVYLGTWGNTHTGTAINVITDATVLDVVSTKVGDVAIADGVATVESISTIDVAFSYPVALAENAGDATLENSWNPTVLDVEVLEAEEGSSEYVVRFSVSDMYNGEFTTADTYTLTIPAGFIVGAEKSYYYSPEITATITIEETPLTVTKVVVGETVVTDLTTTIAAETDDMVQIYFNLGFYFLGDPAFVNAEGNNVASAFDYYSSYDEEDNSIYVLEAKTAGTYTITLAKASFYEMGAMYKAPAEDIVLKVQITEKENEGEGEDNPETAIDSVEADTETVIYDIHGRRVEKIEKGGIYIVNGKKVIK